jgi:hypothetical protein
VLELDDAGTRAAVALGRLQAEYGDAVTRRDWDAVRALFEPDAAVHLDLRDREPITLDGPGALVEFVDAALARFTFFQLTIVNATVAVEPGADQATGRLYICEKRVDADGTWSEAHGLYRDEYRRRDGAWRIAGRRYSSLARTGADGVEAFTLPSD